VRLGKIQCDIVNYLARCPMTGGVICSTTKAEEFRGLDLEQVERSIAGLLRRGIIRRDGIRYVLAHQKEV
jgi:hypothetical protein